MTATQMLVGLADIKAHQGPALFTCLGLGSCIGFAAYDPKNEIGGMVHIMLPEMFPGKPLEKPGKFADTGLPALLETLEGMGAERSRLVVAYAGGAQVFKFGGSSENRMDVGSRNGQAVEELVKKLRLRVLAHDVGGNAGRTVSLCTRTGELRVRTVSAGEKLLCNMRGR